MSEINVPSPGARTFLVTIFLRMGDLVGYARVSTNEQSVALQVDALEQAGCVRIFTDVASGALDSRPQLAAALDYVRPGDVLCTWRLDRLGRNLKHLLATIEGLEGQGIGFKSLTEALDTSSPSGRLVFNIFASISAFERELLRERTLAGLAAARARGRKGGRPKALTGEKLEVARSMYESKKYSLAAIGRTVGVSRSTLYRSLAAPAE